GGIHEYFDNSYIRTIRRRGFFRYFSEAANFSDSLLNFRIFAARISARQTCHCRNLDAELIDFVIRYEKLRHLIRKTTATSPHRLSMRSLLKARFVRSKRPGAGRQSRKRTASATRRCRTETRCPARRSYRAARRRIMRP